MRQNSPFSKIRFYFISSAVLPTEKSTKPAKRYSHGYPINPRSRCIRGFLHFGSQCSPLFQNQRSLLPSSRIAENCMVVGWPWVFEPNTHGADDVEALIHLTQEKKARVGADLCSRKINHDASVEVGPKVLFWLTPSPCIWYPLAQAILANYLI